MQKTLPFTCICMAGCLMCSVCSMVFVNASDCTDRRGQQACCSKLSSSRQTKTHSFGWMPMCNLHIIAFANGRKRELLQDSLCKTLALLSFCRHRGSMAAIWIVYILEALPTLRKHGSFISRSRG